MMCSEFSNLLLFIDVMTPPPVPSRSGSLTPLLHVPIQETFRSIHGVNSQAEKHSGATDGTKDDSGFEEPLLKIPGM